MSGLFQRLKSRKTATPQTDHNEKEPTISSYAFDEEGFLCPVCHLKLKSHTDLEQHYTQTHAKESVVDEEDTNAVKNEKSNESPDIWKQQLTISEQSRILLVNELKEQKQRADVLDEELQSIKKHLKKTQERAAEQAQEIANLRATKDVYHAQLATVTDELQRAQVQSEGKHNLIDFHQDDSLPKSTIEALKRELIAVQQRMNEITLAKEEEIEKLRSVLISNYQYTKKFNQLENILNQNSLVFEETINKNISQIEFGRNEIKKFVQTTRTQKDKIQMTVKDMRTRLIENRVQIEQLQKTNIQLNNDLQQRSQFNDKLTNDLQIEQKQTNMYRTQIETLTDEIRGLEKTLNELRNEKNQLIQTRIDGDENNERQNLVRQITEEKNQFEQQIKELRLQIKQIHNEKQEIQDQLNQISQQNSQVTYEKNQLQNEHIQLNQQIELLKNQFEDNNKEKERRITELSNLRKQYITIDQSLQKANDSNESQKQEIQRLTVELTEQRRRSENEKNEFKLRINSIQKEKDNLEQQLQTKQQTIDKLQTMLSQLYIKIDQNEEYIKRMSSCVHRSIDLANKTCKNLQHNQMNLMSMIEKAEQESRSIRAQTLEQIREEFTAYLTVVQSILVDNKTKFKNKLENDYSKLVEKHQETEKQLDKIKGEYDKLTKEHQEQKQKFEIQLGELNKNLLQVSESLSNASQSSEAQRKNYEKQINALESDLESRTKKHQMQLAALTENLASVRGELRNVNQKLLNTEQIKSEKADIEARLAVSQDERHVLLERSLLSESKNDKLQSENQQLSKKIAELEAALRELALEFQALQVLTNKLSQRRWVDDDDVHACMKCNQTFSVTQRKHHCRNCGHIFCDTCSSKTAVVAATSKKAKRVCDQCYKDLTN